MSALREKTFLHYIWENPAYLKSIQPHFFKNTDIAFVYGHLKNEYDRSVTRHVPSKKELFEIVLSADKQSKIGEDVLKTILKHDMSQYREDDYIKPRLKAWIAINNVSDGALDVIDKLREVKDDEDYVKQMEAVQFIREKMSDSTKVESSDESIGSDFDDPEAHSQDTYITKIPTGWATMDLLLQGGWDIKTLNVLIGETNVGKSVWMHNIAVNAANQGYNVLIVTLEMSEKKVMKRVGSMRLNIPINQYDDLSKDKEYIKDKIQTAKNLYSNEMFDKPFGKIYIKEFPVNTVTTDDLDAFIKHHQDVTGKKIDMLIVDYITIMTTEKRLGIESMLFLRGKNLAEGLRKIAQKHELVAISATQLSKEKFGASDINLADMPESKAIAETADTVFAIIRNPIMKIEKTYILKALKLRDSEFAFDKIKFKFDTTNLRIINDERYDII